MGSFASRISSRVASVDSGSVSQCMLDGLRTGKSGVRTPRRIGNCVPHVGMLIEATGNFNCDLVSEFEMACLPLEESRERHLTSGSAGVGLVDT